MNPAKRVKHAKNTMVITKSKSDKMRMKSKEQVQKETKYGDVYTLEEFIEYVEDGSFIPYDGVGYFHDGEKETDRCVWDDNVTVEEVKKYPYVCWYNR